MRIRTRTNEKNFKRQSKSNNKTKRTEVWHAENHDDFISWLGTAAEAEKCTIKPRAAAVWPTKAAEVNRSSTAYAFDLLKASTMQLLLLHA